MGQRVGGRVDAVGELVGAEVVGGSLWGDDVPDRDERVWGLPCGAAARLPPRLAAMRRNCALR